MAKYPAVVIVGHGSRRPQAADVLRKVAIQVRQRLSGATRVDVAFLEHGSPSFSAALASCYAAGERRLVIIPFFLLPGMHVTADLPAAIASARRRYPELQIVQAEFLGGHPALGEVVSTLFLEAAETAHWLD
ncbi:MAG: CbiX/SirB N-terminal domain-containing protein [Syntrophotalea acetylenica]|jgi:sirohydrochlorin ferrochelatase|uniref:Sirohydrochlorin cobaltochelatase n=1 Tax=Syntrophotalea acetylenica TaxID=29542 RepID=A0A1L3GGD1_SYNAC|nr:CbiX/SirB N-terminal domain-containing protein [Syntrophotalea acetylenica]APG25021.1 hypothetical protein A7E75_08330 [Syntrophotalea acetylenica]APG43091.1 hypothetical protein A6070_02300 [Syntrophotalea acetylenica]MDD4456604.1 CbiX/SirB N-terminal domain-containing protein [Syntrophotalea acetylenica]MDY0260989.1 CbiX/SirB N-terminal domain-containing protein [Syntrophotalea acetylenica]